MIGVVTTPLPVGFVTPFNMPPRRKRQQKKEDENDQINPSTLTVAQLRVELSKKKLDTGGKKAELVKRLQDALTQPSPSKKVSVNDY